MQLKRSAFTVFLLSIVAGCAGWSGPDPEAIPRRRYEGKSLRIACSAPQTAALMDSVNSWGLRAGLNHKCFFGGFGPEIEADVVVFSARELPAWIAKNALEPLPKEVLADPNFAWNDILPDVREQLLNWRDAPFAVPFLGEAPVCFYRRDLFHGAEAEPQRKAFHERYNRPLAPPRNWQELAMQAEFFQSRDFPGKDGLVLTALPSDDRSMDDLFHVIAATTARRALRGDARPGDESERELFSHHFDSTTGESRITRAGFVEALRLLQHLQVYRPPARENEPWRRFAEGRSVFWIGEAHRLSEFQREQTFSRGKTGVCLVPGSDSWEDIRTGKVEQHKDETNRVPYFGANSTVLAVTAKAREKEVAFALLAELAGKTGSTQRLLDPNLGGGMTRSSHLDARWGGWSLEPAEGAPVLGDVLHGVAQHNVRNPVSCLRLPNERKFAEALGQEVGQALLANKAATTTEAGKVLQAVQSRWEKIIGADRDGHRLAYRASLGLR